MPLHPSVNLLWLYFIASNLKNKLAFINLDKLSLLSFPDNRSHLLRLDILIQPPLAYACSVLPDPIQYDCIRTLEAYLAQL